VVAGPRDFGSYDFYNPFMSAVIIHPEHGRLPIWINEGGKVAAGSVSAMLDASSYSPEIDTLTDIPYLAELTVENQLGNVPIITAVITPPYREGLMILDSKGIEWGLSQLECQLGYVGGAGPSSISPIYRGIMTKPQIEIGTETRIAFEAKGVGNWITSRNVSDKTVLQSRKAHVEALASASSGKEKAFQFEVDFSGVPSDSEAFKCLEEKISFSGRSRNNWESIQKLAHESSCYLIHDNTEEKNLLKFVARRKVFGKDVVPVATLTAFDYDGNYGPDRAVFPILSASSPTSAQYLNAGIAGLQNKGVSSNKEIVVQQSEAKTSEIQASAGPKGDVEHKAQEESKGKGNLLTHYNRVDAPGAAVERQTRADGYRGHIGIRLELETIGVPTLFPADMVRVRGLGNKLCGDGGANYFVLKVVHTYSTGGYTTSLDLVSTSSDLGSAASGKTEPVSTTETDEDRADKTDRTAQSQKP
jgi:hypothetical protein